MAEPAGFLKFASTHVLDFGPPLAAVKNVLKYNIRPFLQAIAQDFNVRKHNVPQVSFPWRRAATVL